MFDHDDECIGCLCWTNYALRVSTIPRLHANRLVIHPDYQGLGIGSHVMNATARELKSRGYRCMTKFSNLAVFRALNRDDSWRLLKSTFKHKREKYGNAVKMDLRGNPRRMYSFEYID